MERKLLDYDPVLKRSRYFHVDATGDECGIESTYDVTDIVETNRAKHAQTDERAKWGEWAHVGSVPLHIYYQWIADGVIDKDGTAQDDTAILKALQDRDHLDFRVRPGRLI